MNLIKVGVCLKAEENPFWSLEVRKGIEESAKEFGDVRIFYNSPSKLSDFDEQKKVLKEFVRNKVDAIILAPSHPSKLIGSVREADRNKIPVVIIDSKLDEKSSKDLNFNFIGFDDYRGGFETGELLKKKLSKNSKVAIIEGLREGSYSDRVKGFKDSVKDYLKVVETVSANFEENMAYEKTKLLIKKHSDLKGIFCTSDNMALGCSLALSEFKCEEIVVQGFDATSSGKLAVKNGKLFSTIDTDPVGMGKLSVQFARESFFGSKKSRDVVYSVKPFTKESIEIFHKDIYKNRNYKIFRPLRNAKEFDYEKLEHTLDCPIIIGKNVFDDLPARLKKIDADKYLVVIDEFVEKIYLKKICNSFKKNKLNFEIFVLPSGEFNKTFTNLNELASKVLDSGVSKKSCFVLFGGGVLGNLAGFLAAILMRGVRFVHVPTTVMAQVDSTTGGKQAVNMPHGKNLLGTYHEPEFIYVDINFVKSLPKREYLSGIAEVVKHALCQSPKLIKLLGEGNYEEILEEVISLKISVMKNDPREKREALVLVYGHTIGHALEIVSNHRLNHGEAISIGMVAAVKISYKLGFCNEDLVELHEKILNDLGLPTKIPSYINVEDIYKNLFYDKKERKKEIPFVLLEDLGKLKKLNGEYSVPVKKEIVISVLKSLRK